MSRALRKSPHLALGLPLLSMTILMVSRAHVDQLTKMQARALYQDEATSHRNIKGRAIIDPAFNDFRSFLRHVGPKPTSTATIDRIDTLNPTYGPGLVAWADKKTQSTNRSCVHLIRSTGTNEVVTTRQLAKRQGKSASTIRKRLERGWNSDQIIAGKRAKALSDPLTTADDPRNSHLFQLAGPMSAPLTSKRLDCGGAQASQVHRQSLEQQRTRDAQVRR